MQKSLGKLNRKKRNTHTHTESRGKSPDHVQNNRNKRTVVVADGKSFFFINPL